MEHMISRMKKFRVIANKSRIRLRHYDVMSNIVEFDLS